MILHEFVFKISIEKRFGLQYAQGPPYVKHTKLPVCNSRLSNRLKGAC